MLLICVVALAVLGGCDTGDGKQLKPYGPADYPVATTAPPEVEGFDSVPTGETFEPLTLTLPWTDGGDIDVEYTCDGDGIAPALSWGGLPVDTVDVAIAMVDDSAVSNGQPFVHWVIAGLDPAEIALAAGDVPDGSIQALNFFGDIGYGGPCPPPGDDAHSYRFTVFALNQRLELADGTPASEFLDAIATIAVASTDAIGIYQR